MEEGFLTYQNSKVHFVKFGIGKKLLIALPGFGDPASVFLALETALRNDYTVYSFDLPYHGKTHWANNSFSKKDLVELFKLVLEKERKQRFDLMGYSFGGRIVLASLSETFKQLNKIYLIAPEGIQTDGMSIALMIPFWLRRLLETLADRPVRVNWLLDFCFKIGLLSKFNLKFIQYNLATPERRERVFNTWVSLNSFQIDLKRVKQILNINAIPMILYFGRKDKIIPLISSEKLIEGVSNVQLHTLEEGHRLINEKLNQLIGNQLKAE